MISTYIFCGWHEDKAGSLAQLRAATTKAREYYIHIEGEEDMVGELSAVEDYYEGRPQANVDEHPRAHIHDPHPVLQHPYFIIYIRI